MEAAVVQAGEGGEGRRETEFEKSRHLYPPLLERKKKIVNFFNWKFWNFADLTVIEARRWVKWLLNTAS